MPNSASSTHSSDEEEDVTFTKFPPSGKVVVVTIDTFVVTSELLGHPISVTFDGGEEIGGLKG